MWCGLPASGQAELLEPGRYIGAGASRFYILVDVEDFAVCADIESVPRGVGAQRFQNAIRLGHILARIAENGIVELQGFGEFPVGLGIVDAGGVQGDLETLDLIAALTERLAFLGSAPCEGFREPGDDDRPFAEVVRQAVHRPIRAGESEVGRRISDGESLALLVSHFRLLRTPDRAGRRQQDDGE